MVVCRCRKATKLYCFVHKGPVCAECICHPEHQFCVVRTYSEWVIDGDFDWPPKCSSCQHILEDGDTATTRLGCLHITHTSCLESHLRSFPPHTAPAGYVCPTCATPIWPPNKHFKDVGSTLHNKLKDVISQSGVANTLLGNDETGPRAPPPAFSTGPLVSTSLPDTTAPTSGFSEIEVAAISPSTTKVNMANGHDHSVDNHLGEGSLANGDGLPMARVNGPGVGSKSDMAPEAEASSSTVSGGPTVSVISHEPRYSKAAAQLQTGTMTRKTSIRGDRLNGAGFVDYEDDEDGISRKYSRRGPVHRQLVRYLLPFWSPGLPTLPVTASARKDGRDGPEAEELIDGRSRRRQRSSTMDVRKIILAFAILSCMATALLLYYRLAQTNGLNEEELMQEQ